MIKGNKDGDDSKNASLEKARANGFGQQGVAGRKPALSANSIFEEAAEKRLPDLVKKSFDALDRALSSGNPKIALDAYYKLHKTYYNPDQKIVVEGPDQSTVHNNILVLQDNMNPKELAIMSAFKDLLQQGLQQEEFVEGDVIEVELDDSDESRTGTRTGT